MTTTGLDAAALRPGEDLVIHIAPADAASAPAGTGADDYLDAAARADIDAAAVAALAEWRSRMDAPLTIDGVCLPFVCELPLMRELIASLRATAALRAAIRELQPREVTVPAGPLEAVVAAEGVAVRIAEPGPAAPPPDRREPRRRAWLRRGLDAGVPTRLRRDATLVVSYWPLMPVLDALLATPGARPALALTHRPTGPRRILTTAAQGGWLGTPSAAAVRRASAPVAAALSRMEPDPLLAVIAAHGPRAIAEAGVARRAFRRSPPRLVLGAYDTEPGPRVVFSEARAAGVKTFILAHGAYLMPQTVVDTDLADEVAVWSNAVAPPGMRRDRPVHEVGYPLDIAPAPARPARARARVIVLGQNGHPYTARFDDRISVRHFDVALRALAATHPNAEIVLRPHPSQPRPDVPGVTVDTETPIRTLLAGADLCIGSLTTATLEAALCATPVIVLNLSGFDWPWPLGGDTPVPVAATQAELEAALGDPDPPGREALLDALGANRTRRLFDLVLA